MPNQLSSQGMDIARSLSALELPRHIPALKVLSVGGPYCMRRALVLSSPIKVARAHVQGCCFYV